MIDPVTTRRMLYRGLFLLIWALVLFVRLLPIDLTAGGWPGPNWTMLLAFAWVLRRPNFVPVLLVATLLLLDDFIFMRPPGLWAALTIIGLEFLRGRAQFSRELPFLFEWAMVATVLLAVVIGNRLILAILIVPQHSLTLEAAYLLITVAAYPLIVMISSQVLGVRQARPGETDQAGQKI